MIEKNLFLGGLNSDDEDRFLAAGDYRYALNIRNSKTDKASAGSIENTRGNTEITFVLPDGINKQLKITTSKCLGAFPSNYLLFAT